ncbi:MAG TPA: YIP1 family protein [bacterium]|nr:YIP1 family protein [bacterium]
MGNGCPAWDLLMNDIVLFQKRAVDFIQLYVDEIRGLVLSPAEFFHNGQDDTGFLEPTLFAAVNILIPKLFYALLFAPLTLGISLLFVLPAVVYGIATLFVSAIILHGLVRLFGGGEDFETTYRCVAYSSVAFYAWLIPLPFVNLILFTALYCALLYIALRETHGLPPQHLALLLLLPAFLMLLSGAVLTVVTLWIVSRGLYLVLSFLVPG